VVIGVMGVLVGLLLPALRAVKGVGRQTSEMNAGRQLMLAYAAYAAVNDDAVMPGYKTGLPAYDQAGRSIAEVALAPLAAARYPWRLAKYLDYQFAGLYGDEHRELLEQMEQQDYSEYAYIVSLSPSLGLNATWMGGNQSELGFNQTAISAFGRFYVTRMSEVIHPSRLLVFASARGIDPVDETNPFAGPVEGYFEVRSPYLNSVQGYRWSEDFNAGAAPGAFGFVSPRHSGSAVAAFVDGHVDAMSEEKLKDMRHWANKADRPDWALEPLGP